MVGTDLRDELACRGEPVVALTRSDLDITDSRLVNACRRSSTRPTIIVNCAAYTKVDLAESEESAANAINGSAVELLAAAANEAGALLVQISTDFVFDGAKREPYEVTDPTGPALRLRPLEAPRRDRRDARGEAPDRPHVVAVRRARPEFRRGDPQSDPQGNESAARRDRPARASDVHAASRARDHPPGRAVDARGHRALRGRGRVLVVRLRVRDRGGERLGRDGEAGDERRVPATRADGPRTRCCRRSATSG